MPKEFRSQSTTIPELGVGAQWTTPANQLFYVFDYDAQGGTSFRNNAMIKGGTVKGATDFISADIPIIANATATATVTLSAGQYTAPDTGDAEENNGNRIAAMIAVISAAACLALLAASIIKRRKRYTGDVSSLQA